MNALADFLDFLAEASGTHAFSLTALQLQRQQFESFPIINPENPDPMIGWGEGDPNISGEIKSRPGWRRSRYLRNTERDGGVCSRYLGWAWITLVFDRWEDDFRHRGLFKSPQFDSHSRVILIRHQIDALCFGVPTGQRLLHPIEGMCHQTFHGRRSRALRSYVRP